VNTMDEFHKEILIRWYNEAEKLIPSTKLNPTDSELVDYPLDKMVDLATGLIFCEMSFEAYLMGNYGFSGSRGFSALDEKHPELIIQLKQTWEFQTILNRLIIETKNKPVSDMGPNQYPPNFVNKKCTLKQIFTLAHRIRSNLVHGGKDIHLRRDRVLIHYGFALLFITMNKIYLDDGLILMSKGISAERAMYGSLAVTPV